MAGWQWGAGAEPTEGEGRLLRPMELFWISGQENQETGRIPLSPCSCASESVGRNPGVMATGEILWQPQEVRLRWVS